MNRRVQLSLDDDLWRRVRLEAMKQGIPASKLVEGAIRSFILDSTAPKLEKR